MSQNKLHVKLDTTFEQVLESDKEGSILVFDPENFVSFSAAQVKQLSQANRSRYSVCKELSLDRNEEEPLDAEIALFAQNTSSANATERVKVEDTPEADKANYEYATTTPEFLSGWIATGWQVVNGKNIRSGVNQSGKGGTHKFYTKGKLDAILMRRRKDSILAQQAESSKRVDAYMEGLGQQEAAKIETLGGPNHKIKAVDDTTPGRFRDIQ